MGKTSLASSTTTAQKNCRKLGTSRLDLSTGTSSTPNNDENSTPFNSESDRALSSRRTRGMGLLSTRPLGRRVEEPFWKQTLSVKEKPSEYFRRSARVQKAEEASLACFEDARTGSTRSFGSRCGPALLYERKRSLHMVNIPRARSSPAVPAASSATTWPSRSFRIGPTPANGLSPQGLSRYRLRTPEIAETPA